MARIRTFAVVFGAALVLGTVAGHASAQVVAPTPATATTLKLRTVNVSPALKNALSGKKKVTAAQLAPYYAYQGKTPLIRVKTGQFALEPIDAPEPSPSEVKPAPIPASMQKYAPYVNAFTPGPASKNTPLAVANGVDHRPGQSSVKHQGKRSTCVAFASVAGLEAAYRKRGTTVDLSENHAYNVFMPYVEKTCRDDDGVPAWKSAGWLRGARVCNESQSPYVSDEKAEGTDCSAIPKACADGRRYGFGDTLQLFGMAGGAGVLSINNTNYLEALLDMGFDIVAGFWLTGTDWSDGTAESGIIDVQTDSAGNPLGGSGGHAMLIVGYNHALDYFIIKNSYGTDFGHAGYAYVTYEYMQTYAKYGYAVLNVHVETPQVAGAAGAGAGVSTGGGPTPTASPTTLKR